MNSILYINIKGERGRGGEVPNIRISIFLQTSYVHVPLAIYLIDVAFPQLEDAQVVEGLCVVVVGREGEAETLIREAGVADGQPHVADVVPGKFVF